MSWHHRWHGMLLRTLSKRLAGVADVPDLAQEVYLRILRRGGPGPDPASAVLPLPCGDQRRRGVAPSAPRGRACIRPSRWNRSRLMTIRESETERSRRDIEVLAALEQLPLAQRTAALLPHSRRHDLRAGCRPYGVSHRMVKRYIGKAYAQLRRQLSHLKQLK